MKRYIFACALSAGILIFGCQKEIEHPSEHPSEHPEEKHESKITIENVALAAEKYIKSQYKDGFFVFTDRKGKTLRLKLDKVHKERLSPIGKYNYFVCADFVSEDGTKYDLDFFMEGSSVDSLKVYDITVHKVDGNPLYTWVKIGDIWTRKYD